MNILCIDTVRDTTKTLETLGYSVSEATLGYSTGFLDFKMPPHEFDFIICDIKKPACFDRRKWGPGQNDNFHCVIEKEQDITDETYLDTNHRLNPRYQIIKDSQVICSESPNFNVGDVYKAIYTGGKTGIMFLNPDWVKHVSYISPDIFGIRYEFSSTIANKFYFTDRIKELIPEIEKNLSLNLPLKCFISKGPLDYKGYPYPNAGLNINYYSIVTNNIHQVFGQLCKFGKGLIYVLPEFINNSQTIDYIIKSSKFDIIQGTEELPNQSFDFFISYASEDRDSAVDPIVERLLERNYKVWYDKFELTLGDKLTQNINEGLKNCIFGVVVLSHNFFKKKWPREELDALFALEKEKKILPIRYKLTQEEVKEYYPLIGDRISVCTDEGFDHVINEIIRAYEKSKRVNS